MNILRIKKIVYRWFRVVFKNRVMSALVAFLVKIKILRPTNRYFNLLINNSDYQAQNQIVKSLPISACMNVTNICNYRCEFCEIHYLYQYAKEKAGMVFSNHLTLEDLKNHDEWLKNIFNLELSGASGEPFANPEFVPIVHYLKEKYPHLILTATTNGSLIKPTDVEALVGAKFDRLLFSIHGGDSNTYRLLQGGDLDKILSVIKDFIKIKKQNRSRYPLLSINFALNKLNADSIFNLIDVLSGLDIEFLYIQHYYDARNALKEKYPAKEISYYFDVGAGNKLMERIYEYAAQKQVNLYPAKPLFLNKASLGEIESDVCAPCRRCLEPWRSIKFKGCVEKEGTVYLGVCNRILLFRLNYKEFFAHGGGFSDIWNHPLIQFLRSRVGDNPLCEFCLNKENNSVRCLNYAEYGARRDKAILDFFAEYKKVYINVKEIPGLEVVDRHPYAI